MDTSKKSKPSLRKTGRSAGTRAGRSGRRQGMPRIMIAAGVLIVAGAVWLYWPAGESQPTGLGERHTVVSGEVAAAGSTAADAPVSGEVDIARQTQQITPEQPDPASTAAVDRKAEEAEAREQAAAASEPVVVAPEPEPEPVQQPQPETDRPPEPRIEPVEHGSYAAQVGSFGSADNADREVARLKALGWQPLVRAGNNSAGEMVFRVWVAWFPSRQQAQQFITQNSKDLPGAIPVHR